MSTSLWFFVAVLSVAAGGVLLIATYSALNADGDPTRRVFTVLLSMLFIWTGGQAGRLLTAPLGGKLIWQYVLFLGVALVPVAWLLFALLYTGSQQYVRREVVAGLLVVPCVNLLALYTNSTHYLFYAGTRLSRAGPTPILQTTAGPFWWVHFVYSYVLLGLGIVLLLRFAIITENLYRRQTVAVVCAALFPVVANLIFVSGFPFDPISDITPLAFSLSSLLLFVAIFHGRFLDVVPVAHREVIQTLGDGIIVVDNGKILSANPKAASMLTDSDDADTLVGTDLADLEPTLSVTQAGMAAPSVGSGVARGYEAASVSGGETNWFWVRKVNLMTATSGGTVVTLTDITEKKRFERQLHKLQLIHQRLIVASDREEITEIAVEAARDVLELPITGMWEYDADESVLQPVGMTDESHELFDTQPAFEPGGSLAWTAFETGELKTYSSLAGEEEIHNPETPLQAEIIAPIGDKGVLASGSTTETEFQDTDFDLIRVLTSAVESALTRMERERALRQRERELQQQNERLEEFTSVISHDLRSPLNQVALSLDMVASDDERIAAAKEANQRATDMIDDLLALARQGQAVEAPEIQQIETTVQYAWQSTPTPQATIEIDGELGSVAADHSRLRQALENLFRNAIDHGGEDVRVRIGVLDTREGIYVADDGPGVPEHMREDIFEQGCTTAGSGTGFGLAIVNRVVEAHGWHIRATASTGGGARFEISGMELLSSAPKPQEKL